MNSIACFNSKSPPTLHSTLEIQPATLFGEKFRKVRQVDGYWLYLFVRLLFPVFVTISVFTTQAFRIKEKDENQQISRYK
jgi:hypothetical protein